ncbi:MAG: dihydropyrimidinase [Deinococcota bacterium]
MALLVKNGEIITATDRYHADIYCEDQTISKIGHNLDVPPDTPTIDASGKYVFPGFIDPHVHIYLPFMGTVSKDTHTTGSQAALVGGTTTFIEMCAPSKGQDLLTEGFELWADKAKGSSACDYSFHMAVPHFDSNTKDQLREIVGQGVGSFKVFLAYKNFFGVNDEELWNTLSFAKELGVITTAHCENDEAIAQLQAQLLAAGNTGPEYHEPSRPISVEVDGVHHFTTFLQATGAAGYIVHLSCAAGLEAANRARYNGAEVYVEAVIPHLMLDKTYAERPNFEGAKYVMSPPLRTKPNQAALWQGLRNTDVNTVATDHAPFDFVGQKDMGKDNFVQIPNGIPAIEDRVNILYTYGVMQERIDIHRFVDAASTQAAKIFGLFPKKGTIALGSDADLVIYDPNHKETLTAANQTMNLDYRGFEGFEIAGKPTEVTVRGKVMVDGGKFVGDSSWGEFLAREPQY